MTVRDTMAELIADLRALTDAGTSDYTVGGVSYWSDQQLQDALDGRRQAVRFIEMSAGRHGFERAGQRGQRNRNGVMEL